MRTRRPSTPVTRTRSPRGIGSDAVTSEWSSERGVEPGATTTCRPTSEATPPSRVVSAADGVVAEEPELECNAAAVECSISGGVRGHAALQALEHFVSHAIKRFDGRERHRADRRNTSVLSP